MIAQPPHGLNAHVRADGRKLFAQEADVDLHMVFYRVGVKAPDLRQNGLLGHILPLCLQKIPALLNALHKHQVHATFFVVGTLIREKPELIREIVDAGHTIGNHTMTHPDMSGISTKEAFQKQLEDVEVLYKEATGKEMTKFYRPPQGIYSVENLEMAKEMGYHTFFWSLAYVDWYQDKQPSKEEAFEKLLGRIHPGAIVLLHSTSSTNASILDELLTKWEEIGYTFGTLEELVASGSA